MGPSKEDIEIFMEGQCATFALSLVKVFPHYMIGIYFDDENSDFEDEYGDDIPNPVHVFAYHENYYNLIVDILGVRRVEDMKNQYYDVRGHIDWNIPPKILVSEYCGADLPLDEPEIEFLQKAEKIIKTNKNLYET